MTEAKPLIPFHLAFPVTDLPATRRFFAEVLGCGIGRESERWIDFDFFGHQITAHLVEQSDSPHSNPVDGDAVPVPHFGAVLPWPRWQALADRLRQHGIEFLIPPRVRFEGEPGEQGTFFIRDPSGNALEFKSFRERDRMFRRG
jgi:extradiol dioxygenase family protein